MGYYIAAIQEVKWKSPALKNGNPINFTYYLNLIHRHYVPLYIRDPNY